MHFEIGNGNTPFLQNMIMHAHFSSLLISQSDTYHIHVPPYIRYRYSLKVPEVFFTLYINKNKHFSAKYIKISRSSYRFQMGNKESFLVLCHDILNNEISTIHIRGKDITIRGSFFLLAICKGRALKNIPTIFLVHNAT